MNLNSLFMSEGNQAPLITCIIHPNSEAWWRQHHAVGVFFSGRDWGSDPRRQKVECRIEISLMKTWFRAPQTGLKVYLPTRQSPSAHSQDNVLGTTPWTSSSGPARAGQWLVQWHFFSVSSLIHCKVVINPVFALSVWWVGCRFMWEKSNFIKQ